jgi:hypothetical protein
MKTIRIQTHFARVLVAGSVVLTLSLPVSAASARSGDLHVIKDCSGKTADPGSFCVVTSSNIPEIVVGSKVFYFQSPILQRVYRTATSFSTPGMATGQSAVARSTW